MRHHRVVHHLERHALTCASNQRGYVGSIAASATKPLAHSAGDGSRGESRRARGRQGSGPVKAASAKDRSAEHYLGIARGVTRPLGKLRGRSRFCRRCPRLSEDVGTNHGTINQARRAARPWRAGEGERTGRNRVARRRRRCRWREPRSIQTAARTRVDQPPLDTPARFSEDISGSARVRSWRELRQVDVVQVHSPCRTPGPWRQAPPRSCSWLCHAALRIAL